MWRGCVDVVAMCNLTQFKIDIDIFDPQTGKVIEKQSYFLKFKNTKIIFLNKKLITFLKTNLMTGPSKS